MEILVLFRRGGSQGSAGPSAEPVYHGWPQGPLTDSGSGHTVEVAFDESVFTNGVLWQQDAETFVCMEPWNGWANSVNEAGRHIELAPGASKTFAWSITIG